MFDNHVHTHFSGDSEMNPEAACEKAIKCGLEGIAFTDHLDIDYPNFSDEFLIDFDKYSRYFDELKAKYQGKLKVLKGIEVGIQPHITTETLKTVESYDFDFVIASVHVIDKMDPYEGSYYKGKTKYQAFLRYLEEILFSVNNFENFDVIGHIGYIRRYCDYDDRSLRHVDYPDVLDGIFKKVISLGKGIEVNSSGLRSGLNTPIPDFDIIKRYKELGGEVITIGSDAHYPEHIASDFVTVKEMIKSAGFKYLTHFENRRPIFEGI